MMAAACFRAPRRKASVHERWLGALSERAADVAASIAFYGDLLGGSVFRVEPENIDLAVFAIRIAGFGICARFLDSAFQAAMDAAEDATSGHAARRDTANESAACRRLR